MEYTYEFPDSFYDDDTDEDNLVIVYESEYTDLKHRALLLDGTAICMKQLASILKNLIACAYDTDDVLEAELAKEEFDKCNSKYYALTGTSILM